MILQFGYVIRNASKILQIFVVFIDCEQPSAGRDAPKSKSRSGEQIPELAEECPRVDIARAKLELQRANAMFGERSLGAMKRKQLVALDIHLEKIDKLQLLLFHEAVDGDYIHFKLCIGAILKETVFPRMQGCRSVSRTAEVDARLACMLTDRGRDNACGGRQFLGGYLIPACRQGLEEKESNRGLGGTKTLGPRTGIRSNVENHRLTSVSQRHCRAGLACGIPAASGAFAEQDIEVGVKHSERPEKQSGNRQPGKRPCETFCSAIEQLRLIYLHR